MSMRYILYILLASCIYILGAACGEGGRRVTKGGHHRPPFNNLKTIEKEFPDALLEFHFSKHWVFVEEGI